MIKVSEVDFSSAPKPSPVMVSDKKAQSFAAKDPDFMARIGNEPTSVVCTSDECEGYLEMPCANSHGYCDPQMDQPNHLFMEEGHGRNPPPLNVTVEPLIR